MKYVLEFEYPGLPKRLNQTMHTMHRYARAKYYKEIYNTIAMLVIGKKPKAPLEKVKLTFIRCNYRTLDHDGCVGSMKPISDGLVHAGIIKDDTYKVTGPWDVWQSYVPKGKEHVKIKVEEV